MNIAGKRVVVTGGASGIGAALVRHCSARAEQTIVIDLTDRPADADDAGPWLACDVGDEVALTKTLLQIEEDHGSVDIFVSNAGALSGSGSSDTLGNTLDWDHCWSVNVMAHVVAARVLLPTMIARGSGHFVTVASAAGLLNQIGDAPYSATKHAAVSFAESLAIAHRDDGIGVTLACPQYVATPLIGLSDADAASSAALLTADDVAQCILKAVAEDRFLALPHEDVRGFAELRAKDHDAWIKGMVRLRRRALESLGDVTPSQFYKLL